MQNLFGLNGTDNQIKEQSYRTEKKRKEQARDYQQVMNKMFLAIADNPCTYK
jgi:hypothetical protein